MWESALAVLADSWIASAADTGLPSCKGTSIVAEPEGRIVAKAEEWTVSGNQPVGGGRPVAPDGVRNGIAEVAAGSSSRKTGSLA